MTRKILIVKNVLREGSGLLGELLKERGIAQDVADLDTGDPFPSPEGYAALVVLGGPDSANDQTTKMTGELDRIREALALRIPYLGVCLGLQTLVKAAGGRVVKSPLKEVGFRDPDGGLFSIALTEEGKADPLFEGMGGGFTVFQLHGETVEPVFGMTVLGTGRFCRNQIVKAGTNAYGIQCHFELTPDMFEIWITEDPDLLMLETQDLRRDFAVLRESYTQTGRRLLGNFLKIAGF